MKRITAITDWNGIVSPLFDCAGAALIVDKDAVRSQIGLDGLSLFARTELLVQNNVEVLICGAISGVAVSLIEQKGIEVVSWVRGAVDDVLAAYENGTIHSSQYFMPGCARGGQGRRHGNRRGCAGNARRCRNTGLA
jgi:hypothetical protein